MVHPRKKCRLELEHLEARDCPSAGDLDLGFGVAGIARADIGAADDSSNAVAIQLNGKIIVAGTSTQPGSPPKKNQPPTTQSDFALARFNVDGTLDTTFGVGGKVLTDMGNKSEDLLYAVAIQPDNKIVVAGSSNGKFAVARYNADGLLDTSFDGDGKVITSNSSISRAQGLVLQTDGKIVVGGWYQASYRGGIISGFALARYNANGSLDTSFDNDGIATSVFGSSSYGELASLTLLGDGRIVAAGMSASFSVATIAIYNPDGSLDTSFGGGDGHLEFTNIMKWWDVTVQSGKIVVVGRTDEPVSADERPVIARFDTTGVLDPTFGVGGLVVENTFPGAYFGVVIQGDGKIDVAGGSGSIDGDAWDGWMIARYSPSGAIDTAFGVNGIVNIDPNPLRYYNDQAKDIALQADGKIVVTGDADGWSGNSSMAVGRFLGDNNLRAVSTPAKPTTQSLTTTQAQPLLTEAIARWQSAGFNVSSLATSTSASLICQVPPSARLREIRSLSTPMPPAGTGLSTRRPGTIPNFAPVATRANKNAWTCSLSSCMKPVTCLDATTPIMA